LETKNDNSKVMVYEISLKQFENKNLKDLKKICLNKIIKSKPFGNKVDNFALKSYNKHFVNIKNYIRMKMK
jgi:hypothetical protein